MPTGAIKQVGNLRKLPLWRCMSSLQILLVTLDFSSCYNVSVTSCHHTKSRNMTEIILRFECSHNAGGGYLCWSNSRGEGRDRGMNHVPTITKTSWFKLVCKSHVANSWVFKLSKWCFKLSLTSKHDAKRGYCMGKQIETEFVEVIGLR